MNDAASERSCAAASSCCACCRPEPEVGHARLRGGVPDAHLGREALERELVGEDAGRRGPLPERVLAHREAARLALSDDKPVVGPHDGGPRVAQRDLEPVEAEGRVHSPGTEELRRLQDLVDVPLGVVVREDGRGDVGLPARRRQIAGRGGDGVLGVPRVGDAVAVGVDSPPLPRRRHELHPADRAGRARPHVAAEVRLDLVDRREHLPRDPVARARALPQREELRVGQRLGEAGLARARTRSSPESFGTTALGSGPLPAGTFGTIRKTSALAPLARTSASEKAAASRLHPS